MSRRLCRHAPEYVKRPVEGKEKTDGTWPSDNDKSSREGSRGWLLDLFDLIIGFCLLTLSLLLGIFFLPLHQVGIAAAVLFFYVLVFYLLACIFIYYGATKPTTPLVAVAKDETRPQGPQTKFIRVTYAPITELVVHEVIEQDQTTFFQDIIMQVPPSPVRVEPSINWVDGFALLTTQFPRTNEIIAEYLAGKIHYQTVVFTRMPFHNRVNMRIKNQEYSVRLNKVDSDPILADLAVFLKEFKPRVLSHASDLSAQNFEDRRRVAQPMNAISSAA